MVVLGSFPSGDTNTIEVIDLSSSTTTCSLVQNFPYIVRGIAGGLINSTTPFVCGGIGPTNQCYFYKKPNWVSFPGMTTNRYHFGATTLTSYKGKPAQIFAIGSEFPLYSEIFDGTSWSNANIPNLPERYYLPCLTWINEFTLLLCGGWQGTNTNGGTNAILISMTTYTWSYAPNMIGARFGHGCGKIISDSIGSQISIIVAGGLYGNYVPIKTVEFLDKDATSWRAGMFTFEYTSTNFIKTETLVGWFFL